MKVLLQQNIPHLGQAGEVKDVRDGYARNYLIPRGLVIFASPESLMRAQQQKETRENNQRKEAKQLQNLARVIGKLQITIRANATPEGRMFGSIHREGIVQALAEQGIIIETQSVILPEPLKTVGSHVVEIQLKFGLKTKLEVKVVSG